MAFGHAGTRESSPWVLQGLSSPGGMSCATGMIGTHCAKGPFAEQPVRTTLEADCQIVCLKLPAAVSRLVQHLLDRVQRNLIVGAARAVLFLELVRLELLQQPVPTCPGDT